MDNINFNTVFLLLLLIFSFIISSILKKKFQKYNFLIGIEFAIVGILLSDHYGISLIGSDMLMAFRPLVSLIIGLFGFLFGLEVTRISPKHEGSITGLLMHCLTLLLSAVVLFYVSMAALPAISDPNSIFIAREAFNLFGRDFKLAGSITHLWLALTLGSMAAISSVNTINDWLQKFRSKGPFSAMLPALVAPGEVIGIFAFGVIFSAVRAIESSATLGWTIPEWILGIIGMGCFCALLFWLFIGKENTPIKIYLATIGVVTLVSGVAVAIGVSPLFLNFVCGATLAVFSKVSEPIEVILGELRSPLSIIVLFFSGLFIAPISGIAWLIPLTYMICRLVSLWVLPQIFLRSIKGRTFVPHAGRGFYVQDILIVVIGMDMVIRGVSIAPVVLSTALLSYGVFRILGHISLRDVLADTCETDIADSGAS